MIKQRRKAKDKNIEELITAFGNAQFDCGEYECDDPKEWDEGYSLLMNAADDAKAKLLDALGL